jgi:hypothetical protein
VSVCEPKTWLCGISSILCGRVRQGGCGLGVLIGFSSSGSTGFRPFWRWKSRARPGRPRLPAKARNLIRQVSLANPLWGAPRIHGELLKVGIDVAQSTVAKYVVKGRRPPSQSWKTFLRNHADGIASVDFFVVPTAAFKLLFGFVVLRHDRRRLVHIAVTTGPAADWVARQISDAFPWDTAPGNLIRDRDSSVRASKRLPPADASTALKLRAVQHANGTNMFRASEAADPLKVFSEMQRRPLDRPQGRQYGKSCRRDGRSHGRLVTAGALSRNRFA